jgi:hypothetical protein
MPQVNNLVRTPITDYSQVLTAKWVAWSAYRQFSRRLVLSVDTRDSSSRSRLSVRASYGSCKKDLAIISRRPKFAFVGWSRMEVVPAPPQFLQRLFKLLWNSLLPTAVKADFQSELSDCRKWQKITW